MKAQRKWSPNPRLTRLLFGLVLVMLVSGQMALAQGIERRRDQYGTEFSYFLYPIFTEIPGLGSAAGFGGTIINMFDTDMDFTAFNLDGDFTVSGYALLNVHLLQERLIFDVGIYDYDVLSQYFERGINSQWANHKWAEAQGDYAQWQLTLTFAERMFEVYMRERYGNGHVGNVYDSNMNLITNVNQTTTGESMVTWGMMLDYTDDLLDPRQGMKMEWSRAFQSSSDPNASSFYVDDYNLTGFIPFRGGSDTLVLNYFRSGATITQSGALTDAELRAAYGLGCAALPTGGPQEACLVQEDAIVAEHLTANLYGVATPIGGTSRLRAYPNGRFWGGNSQFMAAEYRWNFKEEHTPFNAFIARGVRTGYQMAFFYEAGSVADDPALLNDTIKTSYGVGLRLLLKGLVVRLDLAQGDEGNAMTFFINYPFGMVSVDNSN